MKKAVVTITLVIAVAVAPLGAAVTSDGLPSEYTPSYIIIHWDLSAVTEQHENKIQDTRKAVTNIRNGTTALASRSGTSTHQESSVSQQDIYWLSRIISAEARGESLEGKIAVGAVIINRINDPRFPKTVQDVIFQQGQFDPVRAGTIYNEPTTDSISAAMQVLHGENPVPNALFFYNPKIATDQWVRQHRILKRIGNHAFAA